MDTTIIIFFLLAAYLIGAVPTAVWVGKLFYGIDVRQHGSGNAGATNTFRVLGKKPGSFVMAVDIFKGWAATSLAHFMLEAGAIPEDKLVLFKIMLGVLAVVGHIFPVYAGFKGGKGVATLMGMVLAIHLEAALICLGIFIVVLLISRYVSLGSMIAAICFPLLLLLPRFQPDEPLLIVFGFLLSAMVVFTHKKNINRLLQGQESKANIFPSRKK